MSRFIHHTLIAHPLRSHPVCAPAPSHHLVCAPAPSITSPCLRTSLFTPSQQYVPLCAQEWNQIRSKRSEMGAAPALGSPGSMRRRVDRAFGSLTRRLERQSSQDDEEAETARCRGCRSLWGRRCRLAWCIRALTRPCDLARPSDATMLRCMYVTALEGSWSAS